MEAAILGFIGGLRLDLLDLDNKKICASVHALKDNRAGVACGGT